MATIKEALQNFNPWWSSKEIKITFSNRHVYHEIKKFIASKQIIALSGLRRVGKTTIMLKLAEELMKKDYLPENVIYFSFDEFKDAEISAIIKTYEEMSEKNLRSGKFLVLFDEVQKLNDWQNQLKTVYDLYGSSVKLVISGSESLFIRRKSKESLAGRIFEFRVEPLSFTEFLSFKKFNPKPIGMHEKELAKLFDKYILTQGFPELVDEENKDYIKKYINEGIVEKVVYSDIPKLFRISDPTVLESVLRPLLEEPGQLIELSNWSKELGISRQTLSLYLRYLEESFIVKKVYNFSKSKRKTERRLKKYYPAVVSEDLLFRQDDISRSHAFEWIVIRLLNVDFFWRDPYKNEVDAVAVEGDKISAFEVKYGKIDTDGLITFMQHFKINSGTIISKEAQKSMKVDGKNVEVTPAYRFFCNGS